MKDVKTPARSSVWNLWLCQALLGGLGFLFSLPFLWMVSTSLKPLRETMRMPPTWLPWPPQWQNYPEAMAAMGPFWLYAANSFILAGLNVVGTVFSSALVAYGFSRLDWKGRDALFFVLLMTMMIPFPVIMVPLYGLFRELGWIGTMKPLWAPAFLAGAFNVFLLRQFFLTLPRDLTEAARIDGCGEFRIFWQIILPLAKPALLTVALFQFMATWNDFLGPLIFLAREEQYTLALGLQALQSTISGTPWHHLMAASTLVVLPVLVLFFLTQRTFLRGIASTGLK